MKVDIHDIAQAALAHYPDLLFKWLPGGKLDGHEFRCGSLQGEPGESLSINTRTGKWADFAGSDKGGDPVSLYAAIYQLSQLDAAKQLAGDLGLASDTPSAPVRVVQAAAATMTQEIPAPGSPPDVRHRLGRPSGTWCYRTLTGETIGYIHRFDKPDGKKEILPQSYWRDQHGKCSWQWKSFTDPRPLYNLPALVGKPDATVMLVEGEKTADFAATLLPRAAVLTWPGGSKATGKVDWRPLVGRKIMLMPDNDLPGFEAMNKIAVALRAIGCTVKFVLPPSDVPEGWDLADSEMTPEAAQDYVRANLVDTLPDYHPQFYGDTSELPEFAPQDLIESPAPPPSAVDLPHVLNSAPFRCLGFDKEFYYYLATGKQQIISLSAAGHTKNNLLQIASRHYWKLEFPKGKTDDFDVDAATDAMLRMCERQGVFQHTKVRGRGAWYDAGRVVVHLGDRIIVDQEQLAPIQVESNFIYEQGVPMRADFLNPLTNKEANRFIELMDMLSWEKPINAKLAAGWCVVAHIGGVLRWRPHVWVVGRKGSGKTYVMNNMIRPVLGDNCLFVQAGSSEAGIRQTLGSDALPVLFDEAEGEDTAAHQNIQRVLGLVRQSSSETGGQIAKGTPGGRALKFTVRSCFAFSSINANLVQQSDRSRVTVLELNNENRRHDFADITRAETELLTDDYIKRFYARAVAMAGVIRENAVTFARATAAALGEQRAGDQIGALLAGAYALYSDKLITFDAAVDWVGRQDWHEQREEIQGQSDELALWSFIMQQKIRVKAPGGDEDLPIGVLVDAATCKRAYGEMKSEKAAEYLMRVGLLVDGSRMFISNTNPQLGKLLANTQWSTNWGRVLKRLRGAEAAGPTYFGFKGSEARATVVELDLVM